MKRLLVYRLASVPPPDRKKLLDRGFGLLAHRGKAGRKAIPPAQLDDQGIMRVVTREDKATRS